MKYKVSSKAKSDLINIWKFSKKNWSVDQADRYYRFIIEQIGEVSINPDLGKSYDSIRKGYWGIGVKSHIIFYKIGKDGIIEAIRILHQRMDLKSRIKH